MDRFCLPISDNDEEQTLLYSPSMTTVVKNVVRHVKEVLPRELTHSTAISRTIQTHNPTAYTA
jgi:hypothetical protein